jgi:Flp pilus assembly protein TadD
MKALVSSTAVALALLTPALSYTAPTETQVQGIAAAKADYAVAKTAIEAENWDAAIAALKSAERNDPGNADVQNMLGYTHRQKGEVEEAFKYYNKALELNPYHRGAHEYMGRAYLAQSRVEKAQEHLAKLEQICPEKCAERDSLKKAIADWDPWKRSARGARPY